MITENVINNRLEMKNKMVYLSKTVSKGCRNSGQLDRLFYAMVVSFVQQMPNSSC